MEMRRATMDDLDTVVELFDQYRVFYKKESDKEAVRRFLSDRIQAEESVIFIVVEGNEGLGFTQLYPTFSSVSLERMWILNDLFVAPTARKLGVASMLIDQAKSFSLQTNSKGLILETDADNVNAQNLYDKTGFEKDTTYHYYFFH